MAAESLPKKLVIAKLVMGSKGAKFNEAVQQLADLTIERLAGLGDIEAKKMFGGMGLFGDGKMFGMFTSDGEIYFKVDDSLLESRLALGAEKHKKMPYATVPDEVQENNDLLRSWAAESMALAQL